MQKSPSMRRIASGLALTAAMALAPAAHATILNYSFVGTAATGSTLNLGAGAIDVSGVLFTASGQMVNDVDMYFGGVAGDSVGAFAATSVYNFGVLGAFATDFGADFYGQNCVSPASVSCALLMTVNATAGFRIDYAPAVAGDPDFGIDIGTQTGIGSGTVTRTQTNSFGHSLTMDVFSMRSVTTSAANAVPEPATLAIVGLGLVGLCFSRRRKTA